jgi:hypothetical protein
LVVEDFFHGFSVCVAVDARRCIEDFVSVTESCGHRCIHAGGAGRREQVRGRRSVLTFNKVGKVKIVITF